MRIKGLLMVTLWQNGEKMPEKMPPVFSKAVVHACQPGWHVPPRLAAALFISPWMLAPRLPLRQVKEKCCMSGRDKGKMERRAGSFLLRGTEQTHRPHNPTTVVMLYLADCVTARWHPPTHTHSQRTALS